MSGWRPQKWATEIKEGDVLAVSVTSLRGVYFSDRTAFPITVNLSGTQGSMGFGHFLSYLDARYRPAATAGYSIYIYKLTPEFEK